MVQSATVDEVESPSLMLSYMLVPERDVDSVGARN